MTECGPPVWIDSFIDAVSAAVAFKGPSGIDWRYSAPGDTTLGCDLLELAPAVMEVSESGPDDGRRIYGIIHRLDLLAVREQFDFLDLLDFGCENDGTSSLLLQGTHRGRPLAFLVHTEPFDDAEVEFHLHPAAA